MRFLILGSTGMVGHMIMHYLRDRGHYVVGFSRSGTDGENSIVGDAFDMECISNAVSDDYDIVINSIGILNNQAEVHKEKATYLNSFLPHFLAYLTEETHTRVFHMSTDCVFAGNTGPYSDNSWPDGKTFYDRSKALGELCDRKNLTFRCSIIGPDLDQHGIGLLNWFMLQHGEIKGYKNAIWSGLTTLELAKAMETQAHRDTVGLINMVPAKPISKYDLLVLLKNYFHKDDLEIISTDRPMLDKTLIRSIGEDLYIPLPYELQVKELEIWMRAHADMYPHYRLSDELCQTQTLSYLSSSKFNPKLL
ncbi:sugar nucleotide-binding protein [Adlercreutzia sp. ZJ154]|uniref:sugar nucleotide-binding protein n=1 Tax=Adlercreutzia sp. ZJ154 TaxID=2709790 RepID=UPI0013EB673E|nr:sugar nucleotide-binding protein [Adlercreutzia sp. ZJ154]